MFAVNPSGEEEAFVPYAGDYPYTGDYKDILCVQEKRVVTGDNTVRYKNCTLQIPADNHRHHDVKARIRVHDYPSGQIAICHGSQKLAQFNAEGENIKTTQKQAA